MERMTRNTRIALGLAMFLAAPTLVQADLAVFTDGRILRVDDARLIGDEIHLKLPGGGMLEVSARRIDRVVDDEIDHGPPPDPMTAGCAYRWRDEQLPAATPFADLIQQAARSADVHPRLLAALVRAESAFDPLAVSRAGAKGLCQLMPSAASDHRILDVFDPAENLRGGATHLRVLLDRFDNLPLALAAYNAGATTVDRYGGVPPYRETRGFLRRILTEFCGIG
jgi:hypothetical protein